MELVPAQTVKGPLPPPTALNYARQIAEALEAARELKQVNVTRDRVLQEPRVLRRERGLALP
jgi:hypothetical protein